MSASSPSRWSAKSPRTSASRSIARSASVEWLVESASASEGCAERAGASGCAARAGEIGEIARLRPGEMGYATPCCCWLASTSSLRCSTTSMSLNSSVMLWPASWSGVRRCSTELQRAKWDRVLNCRQRGSAGVRHASRSGAGQGRATALGSQLGLWASSGTCAAVLSARLEELFMVGPVRLNNQPISQGGSSAQGPHSCCTCP